MKQANRDECRWPGNAMLREASNLAERDQAPSEERQKGSEWIGNCPHEEIIRSTLKEPGYERDQISKPTKDWSPLWPNAFHKLTTIEPRPSGPEHGWGIGRGPWRFDEQHQRSKRAFAKTIDEHDDAMRWGSIQ